MSSPDNGLHGANGGFEANRKEKEMGLIFGPLVVAAEAEEFVWNAVVAAPETNKAFSWTGVLTEAPDENGLQMEGVEIGLSTPSDQDLAAPAEPDAGLPDIYLTPDTDLLV